MKKRLWFQTDLFGPGVYVKSKQAPAKPPVKKSAKKPSAKKG